MQFKEQSQNTKECSIAKVEKKLNKVEKRIEDNSLALEMLKSETKRANSWKAAFYVTLISAFLLIAFVVGGFVWLWNQYEYSSTETVKEEISIDSVGGGNANYIGNDGDITNG